MDGAILIYADRSDRAKLRFTGEQRAWFLHQILTQATEDMAPGDARDAAMITAHGRMLGYLELLATGDAIFAHFEPELRATLPDEIRRYVFSTRVDIADVTEEMGLVLVAGQGWRDFASAEALAHPTHLLGIDAGYLWVQRADKGAVVAALEAGGATSADEDTLEAIRIEHGRARWGRDMNWKTIPLEAGIEDVAVHFDKGCYVGQEAIAKIHFRGKVNRRLRRLEAAAPIPMGTEVSYEGKSAGLVTSSRDGIALAMLRHTVEPGSVVDAGGVEAKVMS